MNKFELLSPAGDLLKLKVAYLYGADAVYVGGTQFSLRSRASNFSIDDLREGVNFAHSLNKKLYVTCNIVMHERDLDNLLDYLKTLDEIGIDAIITSSLYMAKLALSKTNLHVHISTQDSILNSEAIKFYKFLGVERVVLARECSLDDIKQICSLNLTEIEVFVHGGMCSSYSGKCMLSNCMTNRDANRGGCAHSCRWRYDLYQNDQKLNPDNDYFSMASKDLCAIDFVPDLIDAGVDSFKVEGRMKSINYIACVMKAYRMLIDDYLNHKELDWDKYHHYLNYAENRLSGIGFFNGNVSVNEQLFELENECKLAGEFVGIIDSYDKESHIARMILRNKIEKGHKYLAISSINDESIISLDDFIIEGKKEQFDSYSVADSIVIFKTDIQLNKFDIVRVRKE